MAWDENRFGEYEIITGDNVYDEIACCFNKIKKHYEDRFDRNPTVAELMYSFLIALKSDTGSIVSDPGNLDNIIISMGEQT